MSAWTEKYHAALHIGRSLGGFRRCFPPRERGKGKPSSFANRDNAEFALGRKADMTNYPARLVKSNPANPFRRIFQERKEATDKFLMALVTLAKARADSQTHPARDLSDG